MMPTQNRSSPRDTPALLLALLATAILFAPISYHMVLRSRDYVTLLRVAYQQAESGIIIDPHFLYGAIIITLARLFPSANPFVIAFTLDVLGHMVTGWALFVGIRAVSNHHPPWARVSLRLGGALVLQLVWAITIPMTEGLYFGYIGPNPYHSPTQTWLNPIALGLFYCAERVFRPIEGESGWFGMVIGIFVSASTLFKPNFILCLLPALVAIAVYRHYKGQRVRWRLLLGAFIVPALVTLAWQYPLLQSYRGGVRLAPFYVVGLRPTPWLLRLGLSLSFPIIASVWTWQTKEKDIGFALAWLALLFGLGYFYGFAENNQPHHMNFYWSASVALFVLFVHCYRLCVINLRGWRQAVPFLALGAHFFMGVNWWRVHLSNNFPIYW